MLAITWDFYDESNYRTTYPATATGSSIDYISDTFLWRQWVSDVATGNVFTYDYGYDVDLNTLLIYNHNLSITSRIRLKLTNDEGVVVYDNTWDIGVLEANGFGLEGFGLDGFGGYANDKYNINPYNMFSRIFSTKFARYAEITIFDLTEKPKIGYMSLGKTFVPKYCSIQSLRVQYKTNGTQNKSLGGTIIGKSGINVREISLKIELFDYHDFKEMVQLLIDRNISRMIFFTLSEVADDSPFITKDLQIAKDVLSLMCYIDKDNYPDYEVKTSKHVIFNVKLLEAL